VVDRSQRDAIADGMITSDDLAIVLRTMFSFNDQNVTGFLFIITSEESFGWLKTALRRFLEQYEC